MTFGGARVTNPAQVQICELRTSAVEDGDDFIINGQKIWTSGADNADWMFCLVRTDFDAPKHDGISFVLFDTQHNQTNTVNQWLLTLLRNLL